MGSYKGDIQATRFTSAINKVAPAEDVVFNVTNPAPVPSDATMIPLNLIGPATIAVEVVAVNLVACTSPLKLPIFFSL